MNPAEPSPAWLIELFPRSYVPDVIQDILDALSFLKLPPEDASRPEEHLTGQLFDIIKRKRRYLSGPLEPSIEHWLSDRESRVDFRFSCGKGLETYFVVEAKRLFTTYPGGASADLLQAYIDKGMMRFIGGRYAPFQEASAMLGYVFDVTCADARCRVKTAVEKRRHNLHLVGDFGPSPLAVTPPVDETNHALCSKTFTLYHLFAQLSPRYGARQDAPSDRRRTRQRRVPGA
jgi:hypothetical protein